MGCWLGTCGISNLSICEGDKVRLFVLEKRPATHISNKGGGGFCHPDEHWRPVFLPVTGTYDDYGSIEDWDEDLNTDIIKHYYGSLKNFFHDLERGTKHGGKLGHMLVLEDVYKYVISIGKARYENVLESFMGPPWFSSSADHQGNSFYIDALEKLGYEVASNNSLLVLEGIRPKADLSKEDPKVLELRKRTIEMYKFIDGMHILRKFFSPQSGAGSQTRNEDEMMGLFEIMEDIVNERRDDDYEE